MGASVRVVALVAASLVVVACSGGAPASTGGNPQGPQQHRPPPVFPPPPVIPPPPPPPPVVPLPPRPAATSAPAFPIPIPPVVPPAATPNYPAPVDFQDAGVNPFVDPLRDPFSTFAMDVDTASYGVARRFLRDGFRPDRDSVRLEEFVNAFDYGYEAPSDTAFAIRVDGGPTPFTPTRSVLLRIGIQARTVPEESRKPVSLTFVIDTSGSMDMEGRLQLVKAALGLLVTRLQPNDSVAVVTFGDSAHVVLNPTSAAEPQAILAAINALQPGGSTNAQAGLEFGYDLAALGHRAGAVDRVVLASDGVANVGLTDADSILQRIDREVDAGVELVAVGVGMGNFNDVLLEQLADRGNGFYTYINDALEADRVFGSELVGTLETVARDAKVQVEFRSGAVLRYRLLGYENRRLADQDFTDPYVDAGEMGAGHSVTALYEIEPNWGRDGFLGTVRLRWIDPATNREQETARDIDLFAMGDDFASTGTSFRLAASVAGFAEILRDSPYATSYTLGDVAIQAADLARSMAGRVDVQEFRELTDIATRLPAD